MEPVSTLIIVAAFLGPAASTRRLIWDESAAINPKVLFVDKKYPSGPFLPGAIVAPTTHILYKPDVVPTFRAH